MQKMRRCAGLEWAKVFHWRSEQMIDGLQYLCVLSLTQTVLPKLVLFHIPTTVTSVASTSHKMSALRNSKNIKRPSSKSTCTWGQAELGVWRRLGPDHWTDRELPEPKQIWIFKKEKKKEVLSETTLKPWNSCTSEGSFLFILKCSRPWITQVWTVWATYQWSSCKTMTATNSIYKCSAVLWIIFSSLSCS